MTADQALREHGLDGRRLLGIARDVATHKTAQLPYASSQLREDLVSFLVEQGIQLAVKYDPSRSKPGYTFPSYLWDVMAMRVPDFFRRKSEGFGDKRSGNHDRILLCGNPLEELPWATEEVGYDEVDERLSALA